MVQIISLLQRTHSQVDASMNVPLKDSTTPQYTMMKVIHNQGMGSSFGGITDYIDPVTKRENVEITESPSVQQTLSKSIQLPLPTKIQQAFEQGWGSEDTNAFDKGLEMLTEVPDFMEGIAGTWNIMKNSIIGKLASSTVGSTFQKKTGLAYNPYMEMLYEGPSFRTFSFDWSLYPRNEQESRMIREFCLTLKKEMHPEYTSSKTRGTFIIPSTFHIEFRGTTIPKMEALAMTGLDIDYTEQGQPRFFYNGEPAFIGLSMRFKEMDILTRDRFDELEQEPS